MCEIETYLGEGYIWAGGIDDIHVNFFHFRDWQYPQREELEEPFKALLSNFLPNEHIFS